MTIQTKIALHVKEGQRGEQVKPINEVIKCIYQRVCISAFC